MLRNLIHSNKRTPQKLKKKKKAIFFQKNINTYHFLQLICCFLDSLSVVAIHHKDEALQEITLF